MKVYVVMGNDYPDAVYHNEKHAEKFCKAQKKIQPRIYWCVYEFEVRT